MGLHRSKTGEFIICAKDITGSAAAAFRQRANISEEEKQTDGAPALRPRSEIELRRYEKFKRSIEEFVTVGMPGLACEEVENAITERRFPSFHSELAELKRSVQEAVDKKPSYLFFNQAASPAIVNLRGDFVSGSGFAPSDSMVQQSAPAATPTYPVHFAFAA